jgi:hypothetical protein
MSSEHSRATKPIVNYQFDNRDYGTFTCRVCGLPGKRRATSQKVHAGWCHGVWGTAHSKPADERQAYIETRMRERRERILSEK